MNGTIFLIGGINDVGFVTGGWKRGLTAAGLSHRIEHFRWQQPTWWALPTFADLWNTAHHRRSALELAVLLAAARPSGPIHVLAHSAGTAIASYALASMPPGETIRSAAFVGSGLSPSFDLTPVLDRCDAGLLSVECATDLLFLGAGTLLLGTCDRRRAPAAGLVGFRGRYRGLKVLRWRPRHVRSGWVGGHLSVAAAGFARSVLADWVREAEAV